MASTFSSFGLETPIDVHLTGPSQWTEWYQTLWYYANQLSVWHRIDPDNPFPEIFPTEPPIAKGSEELIEALNDQRREKQLIYLEAVRVNEIWKASQLASQTSAQLAGPTTRSATPQSSSNSTATICAGPEPAIPTKPSFEEATFTDIKDRWQAGVESNVRSTSEWDRVFCSLFVISNWINRSVDKEILRPIRATLLQANDTSVRALVCGLKEQMVPGAGTTEAAARQPFSR